MGAISCKGSLFCGWVSTWFTDPWPFSIPRSRNARASSSCTSSGSRVEGSIIAALFFSGNALRSVPSWRLAGTFCTARLFLLLPGSCSLLLPATALATKANLLVLWALPVGLRSDEALASLTQATDRGKLGRPNPAERTLAPKTPPSRTGGSCSLSHPFLSALRRVTPPGGDLTKPAPTWQPFRAAPGPFSSLLIGASVSKATPHSLQGVQDDLTAAKLVMAARPNR